MLTSPELIYFIIASTLIILTPGPDIIYLITQSINHGSKSGFITALGLACGNLFHTLAATLGISAIIQTSASAFHLLKILGICYLLYLALGAIKKTKHSQNPSTQAHKGTSAFLHGLLMNILNPKVALFFIAFLPQFIIENTLPVWQQMLTYGISFTLLVVIIFGSIGLFAGYAKDFFHIQDHHTHWLHWLSAFVFISLAINLVFV